MLSTTSVYSAAPTKYAQDPGQEMAPIQKKIEELRQSLHRMGESLAYLGDKLMPIRLCSQYGEKAPGGPAVAEPSMCSIELSIRELTATVEEINCCVNQLREEVRL